MRYIIAAIVGLAILAFSSPAFANDHTWQRPTECADEDREVNGNRSTPCKYVQPVLEEIEYDVRMVYPKCWELLIYRIPGMKPLPNDFPHSRIYFRPFPVKRDTYGYPFHIWYLSSGTARISSGKFYIDSDVLAQTGRSWELGDRIQKSAFWRANTDSPSMQISFLGEDGPWSNAVLYPDTTNTVELVNSCLELVTQEKANREHAAEIERQEAAEAARIAAEKDAAEKEEEQAQREAESQARIAEQQLAAAHERRLVIARAEEIKTQTLIDEIALQEVLTAILNDIIRIRLASQEDRARITNEYLNRARDASADFEVETSEIESRVQEYLDFNAALLVEIAEYQLSIQNRLDRLRASIEEQRAEIDRLEAGARETAVPAEEEEETEIMETEKPTPAP